MNKNDTLFLPKCFEEKECFRLFESIPFIDDLKIFFLLPLSFIGAILNFVCFIIFFKSNSFKERMNKYLAIYFLNNSVYGTFDCFHNVLTYKYGNLLNNYWILFYLSNVGFHIQYISYTFHNFLTCWIFMELIFIIKNRIFKIQKYSVYFICLLILILTLIFCFPAVFFFEIVTKTAIKNSSEIYLHNTIVFSKFVKSDAGIAFLFISYLTKDITIFVLNIIFGILAILYFRKHLDNKTKLQGSKIQFKLSENKKLIKNLSDDQHFNEEAKKEQLNAFNNRLKTDKNEKIDKIGIDKISIEKKKVVIKTNRFDEIFAKTFIFLSFYSMFYHILWFVLTLIILNIKHENYFYIYSFLLILTTFKNASIICFVYDHPTLKNAKEELFFKSRKNHLCV